MTDLKNEEVLQKVEQKKLYHSVHSWLRYRYGKASRCESAACVFKTPRRYEYALLKEKSMDKKRENFIMLCPSCHRKYDVTESANRNRSAAAKRRVVDGTHHLLKRVTPVAKYNKDGVFLTQYKSTTAAALALGNINLQPNIHKCVNGQKYKSVGGYLWKKL